MKSSSICLNQKGIAMIGGRLGFVSALAFFTMLGASAADLRVVEAARTGDLKTLRSALDQHADVNAYLTRWRNRSRLGRASRR